MRTKADEGEGSIMTVFLWMTPLVGMEPCGLSLIMQRVHSAHIIGGESRTE